MNDQVTQDDGFIPEERLIPPADESAFIPEDLPKEPDTAPLKKYVQGNLAKPGEDGGTIQNAYEGFKKGLGASFLGMVYNGKLPEPTDEDATTAERTGVGFGQMVGDIPLIAAGTVAGFVGGAAAGTAVAPGPGTATGAVIGAGAGGNALPAALRKTLMEYYEKGEIKSGSDFIERFLAVTGETVREGAIGGISAGVGGKVLKAATPILGAAASKVVSEGSEVMTMLASNAAIEGKLPDARDVSAAALMVATIHGTTSAVGGTSRVSKKIRDVYTKTGIEPAKVAELADKDPVLKQELLDASDEMPKSLEPLVDPEFKKMEEVAIAEQKEVTMADVVNEPLPNLDENHPAVREFVDRIGEKPEAQNKVKDFLTKVKGLRGRYIDKKDPIKKIQKLLGGVDEAADDAYILSRMEGDWTAKSIHVVEHGTLDFNTREKNGISLKEVEGMAGGPDKMGLFSAYIIARRQLDYEKSDMKMGFDPEAAREIRNMGKAEYEKAAKEFTALGKRNLKYLLDAELIDAAAYKAMDEAGAHWVPIRHIQDDIAAKSTRKGKVLKGRTGTEKTDFMIEDPRLAIRENISAIIRAAERNRSALALKKQFDAKGVKLEKVTSKRGFDIDSEVQKFLDERNIKGEADGVKAWRHNSSDVGPGMFEVYEGGKRNVYKIPQELLDAAPGLDDALRAGTGHVGSTGLLLDTAVAFSKLKRFLITNNPAFQLANYTADQFALGIQSKNGAIPFFHSIFAMKNIISKDDKFWEFMRSGGSQGSLMKMERDLVLESLDVHEKAGVWDKQWNVLNPKNLLENVQAFGALLEMSSHLAEYKLARKKGKGIVEAGFDARNATLDYEISAASARMAAFQQITAFNRASILGLERMVRGILTPQEIARGAMFVTVPTVMLYFANKEDPRVENLSPFEKDNYWNIPINMWSEATADDNLESVPEHLKMVKNGKMYIDKGFVWKAKKPHLYGTVFATSVERALDDFFKKDPDAWRGFKSTMMQQMFPPEMPNLAVPVLEQAIGKNLFTKRDLIPLGLKDQAPEMQYTNYTSETAKQLAKITPYITGGAVDSPIVVDNYIKSWGGSLGQVAISLIDGVIEPSDMEKPKDSWYNPMVRSFMARRPTQGADVINTFYDRADEIVKATKTFKKKSDKGLLTDEDVTPAAELVSLKEVKFTKKQLARLRVSIDSIFNDKDMKRDEKRQLIDGQVYLMIETAKRSVERLEEIKKGFRDDTLAAE